MVRMSEGGTRLANDARLQNTSGQGWPRSAPGPPMPRSRPLEDGPGWALHQEAEEVAGASGVARATTEWQFGVR